MSEGNLMTDDTDKDDGVFWDNMLRDYSTQQIVSMDNKDNIDNKDNMDNIALNNGLYI